MHKAVTFVGSRKGHSSQSYPPNILERLIPRLESVTCCFLMEGTCYRNRARPLECHLVWTN